MNHLVLLYKLSQVLQAESKSQTLVNPSNALLVSLSLEGLLPLPHRPQRGQPSKIAEPNASALLPGARLV